MTTDKPIVNNAFLTDGNSKQKDPYVKGNFYYVELVEIANKRPVKGWARYQGNNKWSESWASLSITAQYARDGQDFAKGHKDKWTLTPIREATAQELAEAKVTNKFFGK